MRPPIITLLTDFGLKDPYVAEMKGTILSICPEAEIVDITHQIEKFNVNMGAYVLASSAPHFPEGTIHVAVVDPGVGTKRRAIILKSVRSIYVGPDNGLLVLSAMREGIREARLIENQRYLAKRISSTFHGRDIFSRVAAYIATGVPIEDFGPEIRDFVKPSFLLPRYEGGTLIGEVLHIDDFGNVITNITLKDLEGHGFSKGTVVSLHIGSKKFNLKFCSTYGEVPKGESLVLIGSDGFLEVSLNQGHAARKFDLKVGDEISISKL